VRHGCVCVCVRACVRACVYVDIFQIRVRQIELHRVAIRIAVAQEPDKKFPGGMSTEGYRLEFQNGSTLKKTPHSAIN